MHEAGQVHLGVGNTFRKAELVDLPEAIEIGGSIVADGELHVSSFGPRREVRKPLDSFCVVMCTLPAGKGAHSVVSCLGYAALCLFCRSSAKSSIMFLLNSRMSLG